MRVRLPITRRLRRCRILAARLWFFLADPGVATTGTYGITTRLEVSHIRAGKRIGYRDLGSGLLTVGFANALVSDAVTGTSVVPTLARYAYMDSGTGTTAATDGDTALQTQAGPATRALAVLTNGQTATTGNHAAKLVYTGTIAYSGALAITEWGLFNQSAQGGALMDRRVFSALNVQNGDSLQFVHTETIASNA